MLTSECQRAPCHGSDLRSSTFIQHQHSRSKSRSRRGSQRSSASPREALRRIVSSPARRGGERRRRPPGGRRRRGGARRGGARRARRRRRRRRWRPPRSMPSPTRAATASAARRCSDPLEAPSSRMVPSTATFGARRRAGRRAARRRRRCWAGWSCSSRPAPAARRCGATRRACLGRGTLAERRGRRRPGSTPHSRARPRASSALRTLQRPGRGRRTSHALPAPARGAVRAANSIPSAPPSGRSSASAEKPATADAARPSRSRARSGERRRLLGDERRRPPGAQPGEDGRLLARAPRPGRRASPGAPRRWR